MDWASARPIGEKQLIFSGTTHYAAKAILALLSDDVPAIPIPFACDDLESLVYAIFDLSREATSRPAAIACDRFDFKNIQAGWQREVDRCAALRELVGLARNADYDGLVRYYELFSMVEE